MSDLTHFNARGEAHMVDVGEKSETHRVAIARGVIRMQPDTLALIREGGHKKGDVLGIARVAGIMAAKKTSDLVPLCHPLALTRVAVDFAASEGVWGRLLCRRQHVRAVRGLDRLCHVRGQDLASQGVVRRRDG